MRALAASTLVALRAARKQNMSIQCTAGYLHVTAGLLVPAAFRGSRRTEELLALSSFGSEYGCALGEVLACCAERRQVRQQGAQLAVCMLQTLLSCFKALRNLYERPIVRHRGLLHKTPKTVQLPLQCKELLACPHGCHMFGNRAFSWLSTWCNVRPGQPLALCQHV